METEHWKQVEGDYYVSDLGRVKKGDRIIRIDNVQQKVRIGKKVHILGRLVLETFIGERLADNQFCVHKDFDPTNNKLDNLEWGTRRSTRQARSRKITTRDIETMLFRRKRGDTLESIAEYYGIDVDIVDYIVQRKLEEEREIREIQAKGL